MENKESTDFKFLITLSNLVAKMAKGELERRGIPVKIRSAGTNVSWDELQGGGVSPEIFMPAYPIDIYVPENRLQESKEIIDQFGWGEDKIGIPKTRPWQKIFAVIVILFFLFSIVSSLMSIIF